MTAIGPLHPSHDRHLAALFENIASDADSLESIIIVRSETKRSAADRLHTQIQAIHGQYRPSDSLTVVLHEHPQTAGPYKNAGWSLVTNPWTAFIDADDHYYPGRIALMR